MYLHSAVGASLALNERSRGRAEGLIFYKKIGWKVKKMPRPLVFCVYVFLDSSIPGTSLKSKRTREEKEREQKEVGYANKNRRRRRLDVAIDPTHTLKTSY